MNNSKYPDFKYIDIQIYLNNELVDSDFVAKNPKLFEKFPDKDSVIKLRNEILEYRKDEEYFIIKVTESGLETIKV